MLATGGTTRIGYELAKLPAEEGCNLVFISHRQAYLDTTPRELNSTDKAEV